MSKRILVGHDPRSAERAPIAFGVAAARFTGAPLTIASAHADHAAIGHDSADAGLADDASEPLERSVAEATAGLDDVTVEPDVSVRAVLLGGVTRRVTVEAACPVIVLTRGVEATLESLVAHSAGVA